MRTKRKIMVLVAAGALLLMGGKGSAGTLDNDAMLAAPPEVSSRAIPVRGIVEGFYGTPWSHAARLDMLDFAGRVGLNAYIYAPKDDEYHRARWREPYPAAKLQELGELVRAARERNVRFIFAVSPGLDIHLRGLASVRDYLAMERKLAAMYDLGVRDFAVFFDDIEAKDARGQAELLNLLEDNFIRQHRGARPLITVPTEYYRQDFIAGGEVKPYTRDFSALLDSEITVLYTGEVVVGDGLTDENLAAANKIYGRKLGLWWNYPVTDYMRDKLALGAIEKLPTHSEIPAIFFNPMEHAEMSKIALRTGADYAMDPANYDAKVAHTRAIAAEFGELAPEVELFAAHNQHLENSWARVGAPNGERLNTLDKNYRAALARGESGAKERAALVREQNKIIAACDALLTGLPPKKLAECKPQLEELRAEMQTRLKDLTF